MSQDFDSSQTLINVTGSEYSTTVDWYSHIWTERR